MITEDLAPTDVLRHRSTSATLCSAQGTLEAPGGVTVDIARELGDRLGVPVECGSP